jgi:hypothetical protein
MPADPRQVGRIGTASLHREPNVARLWSNTAGMLGQAPGSSSGGADDRGRDLMQTR